jgi:hypothetical protein
MIKKNIIILILFSLLSTQRIFSQKVYQNKDSLKIPLTLLTNINSLPQPEPLETEIDYPKLYGVSAIVLATGIGVHIYQANAWWQNQSSTFKIVNDWKYALWLDKMGHFYGTNLIAHGLSASLEAANVDLENSAIYAAIGAFAFELFVEIEDGFGPQWGFSPGDAGADLLGASYSLGQYYFPVLKHIQPRVSYFPSQKYLDGEHKGNIIDDYAGQKYWFAFRMKELLPKKVSKYWPSFLMLSVGMGLRDWNGFGEGKQDIFIALDFDAETIPLHGKFWQFVKNTLNYLHFPMPGIRISPTSAAFVIVY